MGNDFLDRLFDELPTGGLPEGWTGWVAHSSLPIPTAKRQKERPWCRGRPRSALVEWFPRTTKPPWEGTRWAVHSPADQLSGLSKAGWFVVNAYVRCDQEFDPQGEEIGVLTARVLDEIYASLERFYWDQRRRR